MSDENLHIPQILHGSNLDLLHRISDCSVDSIVTDPPYETGFMGKEWDVTGIAYSVELWSECLRVLKPGGHLLAFSSSRTYHRMTCAIEDAGFAIRDQIMWVYGSGFPKSLDVSKAIDKAAGANREVVGQREVPVGLSFSGERFERETGTRVVDVTAPATDAAQQWSGWGTALKPAHEPIVVARKPLTGTVADNVLRYGTGAINIDASRVGTAGRFPTNFVHDGSDEVLALFPGTGSGSAARFFYCAKAGKVERNAGLEALPTVRASAMGYERGLGDAGEGMFKDRNPQKQNFHPTVKPVALMRYLVRMVTPPNGTVLDPFAGSGTTLVAAVLEGFDSIGMELTAEYLPIIRGRVAWALSQPPEQSTLFDSEVDDE